MKIKVRDQRLCKNSYFRARFPAFAFQKHMHTTITSQTNVQFQINIIQEHSASFFELTTHTKRERPFHSFFIFSVSLQTAHTVPASQRLAYSALLTSHHPPFSFPLSMLLYIYIVIPIKYFFKD